MFNWITGNAEVLIVTLNEGNMTLNQNSTAYFENSQFVLVGLSDDYKLGIKPVSQRDVDLNIYPKEDLHKISLGKGYAKINNKSLCDYISKQIGVLLNGIKLVAKYDTLEEVLVLDLEPLRQEEVS